MHYTEAWAKTYPIKYVLHTEWCPESRASDRGWIQCKIWRHGGINNAEYQHKRSLCFFQPAFEGAAVPKRKRLGW